MNPVRAYFDGAAEGYADRSRSLAWSWLRRREARAVLELSGPLHGCSVLELGCGAGFYTALLEQAGARAITGVDFSRKMLDQVPVAVCRKICAPLESFRTAERFDLILCAGALEFVDDPARVFANAAAMLRTAGAWVILFPNQSPLGMPYTFFHRRHHFRVRSFSRREIHFYGAQSGLRLVEYRSLLPFTSVARLVR